jgi:hypothetical protein
MSLSSHMVDRLHELQAQWARAVQTLPERDLLEQRDRLREIAVDTIGVHQAEAMVLRLLNAEMRRRHEGELPL